LSLKNIFILLLWLPFITSLRAQDAEIFHRKTGDQFQFPSRPANMSFEEFELLSTDLRMQDMMAAALVPGYVHFLIKEKKKGWYLVGLRTLGYAGAAYLALNNKSLLNVLLNPTDKYTNKNHTADAVVANLSVVLIAGTFLYDWFHGRYLLQHKKNRIRFRYSPVIGIEPQNKKLRAGAAVGLVF